MFASTKSLTPAYDNGRIISQDLRAKPEQFVLQTVEPGNSLIPDNLLKNVPVNRAIPKEVHVSFHAFRVSLSHDKVCHLDQTRETSKNYRKQWEDMLTNWNVKMDQIGLDDLGMQGLDEHNFQAFFSQSFLVFGPRLKTSSPPTKRNAQACPAEKAPRELVFAISCVRTAKKFRHLPTEEFTFKISDEEYRDLTALPKPRVVPSAPPLQDLLGQYTPYQPSAACALAPAQLFAPQAYASPWPSAYQAEGMPHASGVNPYDANSYTAQPPPPYHALHEQQWSLQSKM